MKDGRLTGVHAGATPKHNVLEVAEVFFSPLDLGLGRIE